jgi:hypothetical protein
VNEQELLDIDQQVAEKIMGYQKRTVVSGKSFKNLQEKNIKTQTAYTNGIEVLWDFYPSLSWPSVGLVIEQMSKLGYYLIIESMKMDSNEIVYYVKFQPFDQKRNYMPASMSNSKSCPHAVCLAALKVINMFEE